MTTLQEAAQDLHAVRQLNLARDRVAKGAAVLDREMPGWAHFIDLEILRINSPEVCVLGQLFAEPQTLPQWRVYGFPSPQAATDAGYPNPEAPQCVANFELGRAVLFETTDDVAVAAKEHGFDASEADNVYVGYDLLDTVWAEEVAARQEGAQ